MIMLTGGQRDRIERYLAALDTAMATAPADERMEVVAGVREHIESALDDLADPTDADLDAVLRQLGDPLTIATATGGPAPAPAPAPVLVKAGPLAKGWVPTAVIMLMGSGLLLFFMIWTLLPLWLAGVLLLWISPLWRITEKLLGTLIPLATLAGVVLLSSITLPTSSQTCTVSREQAEPVCTGVQSSPVGSLLAWTALAATVIATGFVLAALWRRGRRRVPGADRPHTSNPALAPRGS